MSMGSRNNDSTGSWYSVTPPGAHAPRDGLLVLQVGHVSPRGIELDEMRATGETSPILDVGVPPVLAVACGVVASATFSGGENGQKSGVRREARP